MLYLNYLANRDETPEGIKEYLIVRIPPRYIHLPSSGLIHKPQLSPSSDLLLSYKNGKISFEVFKEKFHQELNTRQDLKQAVKELAAELQKGADICLLCFEKDSDECHRKLIAEFIKETYGLDYVDIRKEEEYKQLTLWDN